MIADMQFESLTKDMVLVFFPRVQYAYLCTKGGFNPCYFNTWKKALKYIADNGIQPVAELVQDPDGSIGWEIVGEGRKLEIKVQSKIKAKCLKFCSLTFDPERLEKDRAHLIVLNAYYGVDAIKNMATQGFEIADKKPTDEVFNRVFQGVIAPKNTIDLPELPPVIIEAETTTITDEEIFEIVGKTVKWSLWKVDDLKHLCTLHKIEAPKNRKDIISLLKTTFA